jgi:predicted PurR-regulated permease PerM
MALWLKGGLGLMTPASRAFRLYLLLSPVILFYMLRDRASFFRYLAASDSRRLR